VIPLEEARARVLARVTPLAPVAVAHREMAGRVLAEDVTAPEDVPPFANSAVDGFAVRSADAAEAGASLRVVRSIAAGDAPGDALGPGEAARIMTGAPVPPGADAVAMVEHATVVDGRVTLARPATAGDAVRHAGEDVRRGAVVFRTGDVLSAAGIGVLANVNARAVRAYPRARVAVLSTGDELVVDGGPLGPGQIRESNLTVLAELLRRDGCEVTDLGILPDDEARLEGALRGAAATHDAIVSSGGVSMGDFDVVKAVLSRIARMDWMQMAIKPAKPFAFGELDADGRSVWVFGLPGNPVSSIISYELLARPALRAMMGHTRSLVRPAIRAVVDAPLRRKADGKVHFMRVHGDFGPDGRLHVRDTGPQGSHQLAATALANGLAVVPDGAGLAAGAEVDVIPLA
jgi:molybdenum cofactor synthesis domain-containing protein